MATVTIQASGGDYTTVAGYEADLDNSGVHSASTDAIGQMAAETFSVSAETTFNGGATLGISNMYLQAQSGAEHDGSAGTGPVIQLSGTLSDPVLGVDTPNAFSKKYWFEDFEIDCNGQQGYAISTGGSSFNDVATFRRLILHDQIDGNAFRGFISATSRDARVIRCVAYDLSRNTTGDCIGMDLDADQSDGACWNNTIYKVANTNTGTGGAFGFSFSSDDADGNVRNNIAMGVTVGGSGSALDYDFPGSTNITSDYNSSEDDTADDGGGSNNNIGTDHSEAPADVFVSITNGSEDLSLKSGSNPVDDGVDIGTSDEVNIDITNTTVTGSWSMGAYEFVSGGGLGIPIAAYHHFQHNMGMQV